ncbi:hypothetical protein HDV00_002828 [Rhizophlyctis rosea]|nr:hypothetical protein HDV00_002828 [Rhizophlyctis rosea]
MQVYREHDPEWMGSEFRPVPVGEIRNKKTKEKSDLGDGARGVEEEERQVRALVVVCVCVRVGRYGDIVMREVCKRIYRGSSRELDRT